MKALTERFAAVEAYSFHLQELTFVEMKARMHYHKRANPG